ncbi:hypothetical protein KY290_036251 [Solanum tuberosum]|uniref:Reverse transcriptase/retrotransposon-derived protein RNase H-like domain-containing protein n=1 Tax=Solanum tuberosum TaxID=4113 RepID=A0ABQ7TS45_SOLTU|nr:hypothetical protein KY290_036251 [Solanum tuberosum]
MPLPSSVKDVRAFLGLTGYYRHFVKGYAQLASPLTDLLKNDSFVWSDKASVAFAKLKEALGSVPVLFLPDFSKDFLVETDASGIGIGAVLCQDSRPIHSSAKNYLQGCKLLLLTIQPLKSLTSQVIQTPEQQRWLSKLIGYDFEIRFRPGKLNSAADALSCVPACFALSLAITEIALVDKLKALNKSNKELLALQQKLLNAPDFMSLFSFQEDLLLFKNCLASLAHFTDSLQIFIGLACDLIFISEFWTEINKLQGTHLAKSSTYHPQTDGQTESLNKCLEMYLRCFATDTPST